MSWDLPNFTTPRLADAVERLSAEQIDALPFGVILLDRSGVVVRYSATERRLSGFPGEVDRRPFFTEIAPCMNTSFFRGRMERAIAAGVLDIAFEHIGDFVDRGRCLSVRIQSASGGGCWIFIDRELTGS